MKMFLGEYNPNITEGSRLALPKKLREQILGDSVILSKGFDKCVLVYDKNDWVVNAQKQIENLGGGLKTGDLERYLYTSATETTVDQQGRIVIPSSLTDYAGISKSTAVIGVGDHLEIWDNETWQKHLTKISEELAV